MRTRLAWAAAALAVSAAAFAHAQPTGKVTPAKAAAPPAAGRSEGVAAVVNDEVISTFDVRQRSALILASAGIPITAETLNQVRGQALRALIDEHLQVQEARDKKITVDKTEIDDALGNIAKQNNTTVAKFTAQLSAEGVNIGTLRHQIEADIAWRRLVSARYGSRVRVSNDEVQDTLGRIKANATKPQFQMAEILLPATNDKEFADAETAANRLLDEMKGGKVSFAAIARQFSAAPSAAAGGDLGWLSESDLRPDLRAAAAALKPGQVSSPLRTADGIEIIALIDARAGVDPRTAVRMKLRQVSAPASQRTALDRARVRIRGCDSIDRAISKVDGAQIVDLGETAEGDLNDDMRQLVTDTGVGQASKMIDTAEKASFIVVCTRDSAGGLVPSRDEVEERLYDQELALLSQRYLMDLRRDSTIITR
jgi:peptidyl-prolyl cis-trans isomerase SurA